MPSNLQEILNSIQKKAEEPESNNKEVTTVVSDVVKTPNPDINKALNVLNQTKNLLTSLSTISRPMDSTDKEGKLESQPILSRLTDQELLRKVKEMEMEAGISNSSIQCSSQPLPPGVQDIPLLPLSGGAYASPTPSCFKNSLLPSNQGLETSVGKPILEIEDKKREKKIKLDPKAVFESEGVPDFVNIPGPGWEDKKGQKMRNFKIDIKLGANSLDRKAIDMNHFDIESISKISVLTDDKHLPSSSSMGAPSKISDEGKFDVDNRIFPKTEEKYKGGYDRDKRRGDERETKRDWKYDRRHWDDGRRYKDDYRRHGRRDRPPKFGRKDRFEDKRSRHLQKEWEGSIKSFEERQRWRNQEIRRDDIRRSRKRADSSTN